MAVQAREEDVVDVDMDLSDRELTADSALSLQGAWGNQRVLNELQLQEGSSRSTPEAGRDGDIGAEPHDRRLGTMKDVAALLDEGYENGPVGIMPVNDRENTYLVTLAGTVMTPGTGFALGVPEDIGAAFCQETAYAQAIKDALRQYFEPLRLAAERRGELWKAPKLIIAGHSLGGMEAQNLPHHLEQDEELRGAYEVIQVIGFGAPQTADKKKGIDYSLFARPGDPVPNLTPRLAGENDLTMVGRMSPQTSLLWAAAMLPLGPPAGLMGLAAVASGALNEHRSYSKIDELADFDAQGDRLVGEGGPEDACELELDMSKARYYEPVRTPEGGRSVPQGGVAL